MIFIAPVFLFLFLLLLLVLWLGWPSRGPSRGREILSLALRLLIAALLILALAGLEVRRAGNQLSVVFLVDNSDSLPPAARPAGPAHLRPPPPDIGPDY